MRYQDNDVTEDEREQTLLDEYDDVVAFALEGDFCGCKLGTSELREICLLTISEELGTKSFDLMLSDGKRRFEVNECSEMTDLLSQINGLHVFREIMNTPPASWVTDIVLIDDTSKADTVARDIDTLKTALAELHNEAEQSSSRQQNGCQ